MCSTEWWHPRGRNDLQRFGPRPNRPENLLQLRKKHEEAEAQEKEAAKRKQALVPVVKVEDGDEPGNGAAPIRQLGIDPGVSDLNKKAPKRRVAGKTCASEMKQEPSQPSKLVKAEPRPCFPRTARIQKGKVMQHPVSAKQPPKADRLPSSIDDMQIVAKKHISLTPTGQINSLEGLVSEAFLVWDADRKPLANVINGAGWEPGRHS